ncbi:MerR family transcriptional regulator [Paucilactobacillus sp. N302-9]
MIDYLIKAFAQLTGVSTRTLRYYHEIGLLVPITDNNGYRHYQSRDADKMQLILMFRELAFDLETIKQLLMESPEVQQQALINQREALIKQQTTLSQTITQLDQTLINLETGGKTMTDKAKFEAFKAQQIVQNNQKYGDEVSEKYGEKAKNEAEKHFQQLTEEQYGQMQHNEEQLAYYLKQYLEKPELPSQQGQKAFKAHQQWLMTIMPNYTLTIHGQLAEMYTADPRFGRYYTKLVGDAHAAVGLNEIVQYYIAQENNN